MKRRVKTLAKLLEEHPDIWFSFNGALVYGGRIGIEPRNLKYLGKEVNLEKGYTCGYLGPEDSYWRESELEPIAEKRLYAYENHTCTTVVFKSRELVEESAYLKRAEKYDIIYKEDE